MDVQFNIDLDPRDATTLADVLGCTEAQLSDNFSTFAKAAADEYVHMLLGKNAFKRASDFLEFRIYLMVGHVLNGRLPDEAMVSRYFQLSSNEARARLRGVTSKYQRGLEVQIRQSIVDILDAAGHDDDTDIYSITVNNQTVIDLLNSALASIDGTLKAVSKVRGTVASFEMPGSSYDALRTRFA